MITKWTSYSWAEHTRDARENVDEPNALGLYSALAADERILVQKGKEAFFELLLKQVVDRWIIGIDYAYSIGGGGFALGFGRAHHSREEALRSGMAVGMRDFGERHPGDKDSELFAAMRALITERLARELGEGSEPQMNLFGAAALCGAVLA